MRSPIETDPANSAAGNGHVPCDSGVGIDIEHCDNLPAAADPRTDSFYVENFTPAEIAYCHRQPKPRESFCGLWCAKEAAKKCGEEFMNLRPLDLEITHDAHGRPLLSVLRDGKQEIQRHCVLSISHTNDVSVAVCATGWGGSQLAISESAPVAGQTPGGSGNQVLAWVALGLGLLNLLLLLLVVFKK